MRDRLRVPGLGSYYDDQNGADCSGTSVDTNPDTGMPQNKFASANVADREPRVKATKWAFDRRRARVHDAEQ